MRRRIITKNREKRNLTNSVLRSILVLVIIGVIVIFVSGCTSKTSTGKSEHSNQELKSKDVNKSSRTNDKTNEMETASGTSSTYYTCITYFTGIGCPHCARTDPIVLGELPLKYDKYVVIEYEIYQQRENAPLLYDYGNIYKTALGVPNVIFDVNDKIVGDTPILNNLETRLKEQNKCPLIINKEPVKLSVKELDFNKLPSKPKIWFKDRILVRINNNITDNKILHDLLFAKSNDDINKVLTKIKYKEIKAKAIPLSGSKVEFKHAILVDGWLFEWARKSKGVSEK